MEKVTNLNPRNRITWLALCILIVIACELPTSIFDQLTELSAYRIAFVSERDGNREIYIVNGDGQNLRRLTNQTGYDTWPTWSPDGSLILFTSARDGGENLYLMNVENLWVKRITYTQSPNEPGVWSPDAHLIAYTSGISGAETELYLVDTSCTSLKRLTNNNNPDFAPTWSHDGNRLAFYSARTQIVSGKIQVLNQIYVMSIIGQNEKKITDFPFGCTRPIWNPKSNQIAFVKLLNEFGSKVEVAVMNADGSNPMKLVDHNGPFYKLSFAWSPSGNILLVSKNDSANFQIYKIDVDKITVVNLSRSHYNDTSPSWSPDGRWITFVSTRDGNKEIYVMRNDGTKRIRLTFDSAIDDYPVFAPRLYK